MYNKVCVSVCVFSSGAWLYLVIEGKARRRGGGQGKSLASASTTEKEPDGRDIFPLLRRQRGARYIEGRSA